MKLKLFFVNSFYFWLDVLGGLIAVALDVALFKFGLGRWLFFLIPIEIGIFSYYAYEVMKEFSMRTKLYYKVSNWVKEGKPIKKSLLWEMRETNCTRLVCDLVCKENNIKLDMSKIEG